MTDYDYDHEYATIADPIADGTSVTKALHIYACRTVDQGRRGIIDEPDAPDGDRRRIHPDGR